MLARITTVTGTGVHVPGDDIDTDRIIPARFMKCVTFEGLGEYAFYDVRHDENGAPKPHPLNDPRFSQNPLLITGMNFGCGSSREHAPQALYRHGIRAVIAGSFAEIFFGNCTTLGIPCVCAPAAERIRLANAVECHPSLEITIDLTTLRVSYNNQSFAVQMPDSAREALIHGQWDALGELLEGEEQIVRTAAALPYMALQS